MGSLCFYGLGLSNEAGAIDRARYVHIVILSPLFETVVSLSEHERREGGHIIQLYVIACTVLCMYSSSWFESFICVSNIFLSPMLQLSFPVMSGVCSLPQVLAGAC